MDAIVDWAQTADLDSLRGDWLSASLGVSGILDDSPLPALNLDGLDRDFFDVVSFSHVFDFEAVPTPQTFMPDLVAPMRYLPTQPSSECLKRKLSDECALENEHVKRSRKVKVSLDVENGYKLNSQRQADTLANSITNGAQNVEEIMQRIKETNADRIDVLRSVVTFLVKRKNMRQYHPTVEDIVRIAVLITSQNGMHGLEQEKQITSLLSSSANSDRIRPALVKMFQFECKGADQIAYPEYLSQAIKKWINTQ